VLAPGRTVRALEELASAGGWRLAAVVEPSGTGTGAGTGTGTDRQLLRDLARLLRDMRLFHLARDLKMIEYLPFLGP